MSNARLAVWVATLAAMVAASACGCRRYKCGSPPTRVVIKDENGMVMGESTGAKITGTGASIAGCTASQACSYAIDGLGDFVVTAPGYQAVSLHVGRQTDECDNSIEQTFEVRMVPESSSEAGVTELALGKSCGE